MEGDRSAATNVGNVNGSVFRRDLDVAMQSGAVVDGVHREGRAKRLAPIEAHRGAGVRDTLRRIINSVRISRDWADSARMKYSAAKRLVIDVRREARSFAHGEAIAVVVRDVSRASGRRQPFKLGNEGPAGVVVREKDGIARRSRSG